MKMRATLVWEYDLPDVDLQAIKDSEENGDPTDEFVEEAEGEFYWNDPITFIEKRLLETDVDEAFPRSDVAEHLERVTKLKVEVVEHG